MDQAHRQNNLQMAYFGGIVIFIGLCLVSVGFILDKVKCKTLGFYSYNIGSGIAFLGLIWILAIGH